MGDSSIDTALPENLTGATTDMMELTEDGSQIDIREYAKKLQTELDEALGRNKELSDEISDRGTLLEKTLDNLAGGVGVFELRGNKVGIKYMSGSFYRMFNVTKEQMAGYADDYVMLAVPEDRSVLKKQILETITSNKTTIREIRFTDVNTGGYFWIQICLSVMSFRKGIITLCAVFIDVTGKMENELEKRAQSEMLKLILQESGESVFAYDVRTDTLVNERVVDGDMTATMSVPGFVSGMSSNRMIHSDDRERLAGMLRRLLDEKSSGELCEKVSDDIRLDMDRSGRYEWYRMLFVRLRDAKGETCKVFGKYYSINEEKMRSQELQLRAERDSLTGLYNHVTFQHKVSDMLAGFPGELCAFFIMDIDDFKHINDAFGHYAGDDLLCDVAVVLEELAVKNGGFSGRLGGDEFAVFLPVAESRSSVYVMADGIKEQLTAIKCGLPHTLSVGISIHEVDESLTFDQLYSESDQALYVAKRSGKNRYCEYSPTMAAEQSDSVGSGYTYSDEEGLVLDEIDDIVYVADMNTFEMYYLNRAAKRSLGIAENDESYKGKHCYEVTQNLPGKCSFCMNESLVQGRSYVWNHENKHVGRSFVLKDKLIDWHGKRSRIEIAVDVSDIRNITKALADSYDMEDALTNSMVYMTAKQERGEKYRNMLEVIATFYNSKNVCLVEYGQDDEGQLYYWKSSDANSMEEELQILKKPSIRDILSQEVSDSDALIVNRSNPLKNQDTEFSKMLVSNRIWSLYAVPVLLDSELLGRVFVFNPERHNGNLRLLKSFAMFIGSEISKRRMKEIQKYEFTHDRQTKCYNRNSYIDYIKGRRTYTSLGIISIDVNETRGIADMFGSDYADSVVLSVVDRIKKAFSGSMIFRMGYDSFIVVCENAERVRFNVYAARLREELLCGEFTACCGYVWSDYDIDIRKMEEHADNMLYSEKQRWYEEQERHSAKWNTIKKEQVKKDIADGLYSVLYQPKMRYSTRGICGAEALVRYTGNCELSDVIDRLEKSGTIIYVDLFVLRRVCEDMAAWREMGVEPVPVSCNFSRVSLLEKNIAKKIAAIVDEFKLPHELIEIEITETVSEQENDTLSGISTRLHEEGFRIAMDDFGTKYSNVAALAGMGFDIVKFDKSMVYDVVANPISQTVLRHLASMCMELGVSCIAEGIETDEQAEVIADMRLDVIQGFICSAPVCADDYVKMLK